MRSLRSARLWIGFCDERDPLAAQSRSAVALFEMLGARKMQTSSAIACVAAAVDHERGGGKRRSRRSAWLDRLREVNLGVAATVSTLSWPLALSCGAHVQLLAARVQVPRVQEHQTEQHPGNP